MEFTNAYILGVNRNNEYFGERTAHYRSVDTISIEGYIDVRSSNTDYKGVRQALSVIDSYVNAANNQNVLEPITINGTGYGTGRLVNLDFPASNAVDENQITIGKYTADLEVYRSGDLRNCLEGYDVPFPQFLDSFSEDVSISLDQDDVYSLSHSLDITYLSGVTGTGVGGSLATLDPIVQAKSLATGLFAQIPSQYSTIIPDSYGGIASTSRSYYTENYNLIDGSCNFEKSFKLLPSGMAGYSLSVSSQFSFDEGGIIKVSEDGTIEPRSPDFFNEAKAALDIEIANSYSRCNTIYNSYKNYLGSNAGTLFNQPVTRQKTINNSSAISNYSVEYTDDLKVKNLTTLESRELSLDVNENIATVVENGTITSINSKSSNFNPYDLTPSRADVKARCTDFYTEYATVGNIFSLKNLNNKFTIPIFGKQISYNFTFTDDATIFDRTEDPIFAKKKVTHNDKIGTPNQSAMIIPNIPNQVLHTPGQTSLGTRGCRIEGQLQRAQYTNNLTTVPVSTLNSAISSAQTTALQDAYLVYANNNLIRSLDKNSIYITNASYSFGSDNIFNLSVDSTFNMTRIDGNAELNLSFSP